MFIRWFKDISIKDVPLVGGKMLLLARCILIYLLKELIFPMVLPFQLKLILSFGKEAELKEIEQILKAYNLKISKNYKLPVKNKAINS